MARHADILPAPPKLEKTATARLSLELAFVSAADCSWERTWLGSATSRTSPVLREVGVGAAVAGAVAVLRAGAGAGGRAVSGVRGGGQGGAGGGAQGVTLAVGAVHLGLPGGIL